MTKDKQFKAEVRRYAEEHGLAYADARRQVLAAREDVTVVPGPYFDELLADLDAPDEPNERVRKAARLLPGVVRREEA
jgi:hypothetical protein